MPIQVQTKWKGNIASHLRMAIYHIVYKGPDSGIIKTGFSTIMFASGVNMKTGRSVKLTWENRGGCLLLGPIKEGKSGIIRIKCEGL